MKELISDFEEKTNHTHYLFRKFHSPPPPGEGGGSIFEKN